MITIQNLPKKFGKVTAVEGPVIHHREDRLLEHYAFNVNGHFYFDDIDLQFQSSDHVVLITMATGG